VRPLVEHAGVAAYVFYAAFALWAVGEMVLQVRTQGGERDPSYIWMLAGSAAGIALAFVAAGRGPRLPGPGWLPVAVGVALMLTGIAFRYWAVRTLGRFFTVTVGVEDDQRVVDTGPYARLRHPSYTGILAIYLGLGIALDGWLSVAPAVVIPAAAVAYRIAHEERELRAGLGEAYEAYSRRTDRLVPGVW
jgi:protein-S-isoprenylcysteine O-methyltransferase Ste14